MVDYKLKIYTIKEFEEKQEELVNSIFAISSTYNSTQTYTENIAQEMQEKKDQLINQLEQAYFQNNKTFCCVLIVEEKPVAYCVCKESDENHWEFLQTVVAMNMQNKGYEYILEKNCVNQIKIKNGKTLN